MAKPPTQKIVSKKHLARLEREEIQRRYLIIGAVIVLIAVVGLIVYGILDGTVLQARKPVAKVNGQTITVKDFQTQVRYTRFQLIQRYYSYAQLASYFGDSGTEMFTAQIEQIQSQLDNTLDLGSQVLDQMIDNVLIEQQAEKMGISVSDEEVEIAMQEAFNFYPNGTPTPAPTEAPIVEPTLNATQQAIVTITPTPTEFPTAAPTAESTALATATPGGPTATAEPTAEPTSSASATPEPTATPYTLEGYQGAVKDYVASLDDYGFTEADLRKIIYYQKLSEKMYDQITADVATEQEQVWARHIQVPDEAAALAVIERINNGEDWAGVAAEVSTDEMTQTTGGDLGWMARESMNNLYAADFTDQVFNLEVGQISQPVQSNAGYHVVQVLGHEIRALSSAEIDTLKQNQFSKWLDGLKTDEKAIQKYDTTWQGLVPTEPVLQ